MLRADLKLNLMIEIRKDSAISAVVALTVFTVKAGIALTKAADPLTTPAAVQALRTVRPAPLFIAYARTIRRAGTMLITIVRA